MLLRFKFWAVVRLGFITNFVLSCLSLINSPCMEHHFQDHIDDARQISASYSNYVGF